MRVKELRQLYGEEQIRTRVEEMAAEISSLYDGEVLVLWPESMC